MFWRIFFKSFGAFSAKILFQTFSSYDRESPSLNIMELPGLEYIVPSVRKDVQRGIKIPIYCSFLKDCDFRILCWKIS
jgi:hypothetical protein